MKTRQVRGCLWINQTCHYHWRGRWNRVHVRAVCSRHLKFINGSGASKNFYKVLLSLCVKTFEEYQPKKNTFRQKYYSCWADLKPSESAMTETSQIDMITKIRDLNMNFKEPLLFFENYILQHCITEKKPWHLQILFCLSITLNFVVFLFLCQEKKLQ